MEKPVRAFAPAKINLFLHVTGRIKGGYHALESLVAFTDISDEITLTPAESFSFKTEGPFGHSFTTKDLEATPQSGNLAVRAIWMLALRLKKTPGFALTLTKNLPLAAGIGGGSADAAASVRAALEYWNVPSQDSTPILHEILISLGADVPACFLSEPVWLSGIGDLLEPAPPLYPAPIVLVNPGHPCPTQSVFQNFKGDFKGPITSPDGLETFEDLISFLKTQENALIEASQDIVPDIANVLRALDTQENCALARMSGSGATCFGLFPDQISAETAAANIAKENPDWWIRAGCLN